MARLIFSLMISIGLFGHHTIAQAANITVNTSTTASVTNVDADNIVQIDIKNEDSDAVDSLKVDLVLEKFYRHPKESIQVFFAQAGQGGPAASRNITVELNGNDSYSVRLDVSQVQYGEYYSGYLCISYQLLAVPHCEQIKLRRQEMAQEAVIVVGQPQPEETVCPLDRSSCKPEEVRLDIREKSGRLPIRGISIASLTAGQGGASLNPMQDLDIRLMLPCGDPDGCPTVGDLWHIDPNDEANLAKRTIPAGGQAVLIISFNGDHPPAQYKPRFSILALNTKNPTGTEVALEIKIRHTGWLVFLILFFSVLGSYGLTKGLRTALQRAKLLNQINRMRQDVDLKTSAQIVPEVRLRAVLARTLTALNAQRWWSRWFYFPQAFEDGITRAQLRLPYIKRVIRLYKFWKRKSSHDTMIGNRALKELRDVIDEFSRTPLEDDVAPKLITQLDNLESWSTEENKLPEYFWLSLKPDLEMIQARLDLTRFQAPDCREWERALSDVAANLASGQAVRDTAVSLGQFAASLDPSTEASIQNRLNDGAKALMQLQTAQLDAIAQAIGNIPSLLKGIDSTGPVPALDAIVVARQTIEDSALPGGWDVVDQALKVISDNPALGTDAARTALLASLHGISNWSPARFETYFVDLTLRLRDVETSPRECVRQLLQQLQPDKSPATLRESIQRERIYAALKVIAEQDDPARICALVQTYRRTKRHEDLFQMVDRWAWDALRSDPDATIKLQNTDHGAFDLIDFTVVTKSQAKDSYLFKHKLEYEWVINYDLDGTDIAEQWRATTDRPIITQFIPLQKNGVQVDVYLKFADMAEQYKLKSPTFDVGTERVFSFTGAFAQAEVIALILALIVAIITGMNSTLYDAALSSSAWPDYLKLAAWGIGIDQTKNILENTTARLKG